MDLLCYITKISKIESNSQLSAAAQKFFFSCVISQRYPKLKAIHNILFDFPFEFIVVLYHKDIQN